MVKISMLVHNTWLVVSQSPRPETEAGSMAVKVPSLNHWTARELPQRSNLTSSFILWREHNVCFSIHC